MRKLEGNQVLTEDRVAPFIELVEPATLAQLVQEVKAENLLDVLGRLGAVAVARILENTNIDFIIRLWNGPLEKTVNVFASSLSELEKHPVAASSIKRVTDTLNVGLTFVDKRLHRGKARRDAATVPHGLSKTIGGSLVGAGSSVRRGAWRPPLRLQRSRSM